MIESHELSVTIAYIQNIKATYARNTSSIFRNPAQIAFYEIYQASVQRDECTLWHCQCKQLRFK